MSDRDISPVELTFMKLAAAESRKHWGLTNPNPSVGTVVVKNSRVLAATVTSAGGRPHSEANAIRTLGSRARGATAYVTLEPCTHFGKTPPCCDLLINSGIREVVIGCKDPNPLVNGKGIRRLKAAGVRTVTRVLEKECAEPNEWFFKRFHSEFPHVTLKTAMSADGKIAATTGDSRWISSRESRKYSHLLRSRSDAVMVGTNTLLKDNPRLDVRLVKGTGKNPHKIVLDRRGILKPGLNIFKSFSGEKIYYFTCARIPSRFADRDPIIPFRVAEKKGGLDLTAVMKILRANEIFSILVEGGGRLSGSLFDLGLIDKVEIAVAPVLISGKDAPSVLEGRGISRMRESLALKDVAWTASGCDMIVKGYVRRYY